MQFQKYFKLTCPLGPACSKLNTIHDNIKRSMTSYQVNLRQMPLSKDGVRPTEENSPDYNRPFLDVDMVSLVNATAIPPDLPHPPTPNPRRPTMTVTLRHPGGRPSQADCDGHNGLMMPSDGIIDSPWPRAPANTVVSLCIDV